MTGYIERAREVLQRRPTMPSDPAEWGRIFALGPSAAGHLVK